MTSVVRWTTSDCFKTYGTTLSDFAAQSHSFCFFLQCIDVKCAFLSTRILFGFLTSFYPFFHRCKKIVL